MTTGIVSLGDISGNDGSTDTETTSDDSGSNSDALKDAVEAVGGNYERAKEYVDENGNKDGFIGHIEWLQESDENPELMETYRSMSGQKRIDIFYLRNMEPSFSDWRQAFYGDSDDPEPGDYNYVRDEVRDSDGGNLLFYKTLFPEPQMDYWPAEEAVVWDERPGDDSAIYVTPEFVETYKPFSREIDGMERPLPPADGQATGGDGSAQSSDIALDPSEHTVEELKVALDNNDYSRDELDAALDMELAEKDRKTAKEAIKREISRVEERNDDAGSADSTPNDDADVSDFERHLAEAGRIKAENDLDTAPAAIAGMLQGGSSEEEVVAALD